jgi:hypothetical protein
MRRFDGLPIQLRMVEFFLRDGRSGRKSKQDQTGNELEKPHQLVGLTWNIGRRPIAPGATGVRYSANVVQATEVISPPLS